MCILRIHYMHYMATDERPALHWASLQCIRSKSVAGPAFGLAGFGAVRAGHGTPDPSTPQSGRGGARAPTFRLGRATPAPPGGPRLLSEAPPTGPERSCGRALGLAVGPLAGVAPFQHRGGSPARRRGGSRQWRSLGACSLDCPGGLVSLGQAGGGCASHCHSRRLAAAGGGHRV